MPDKKLTDNEITIKALKELLEVMLCEGDLQRVSTISHTIDLISRLQAENMALKDDLDYFKKVNAERNISALKVTIQTAKAEAYKECIEKVKDEIGVWNFDFAIYEDKREAQKQLDNFLKELENKNIE